MPEAVLVPTSVQSVQIVTARHPPEGAFWEMHEHEEHELLSAISHGATVATEHTVHSLPRGSAMWIPARCAHAVRADAGNVMRCTWFAAPLVPDALLHPTVLTTSPLLDAVLRHLDTEQRPAQRQRAEAFALDLLSVETDVDGGLPQPRTHWLREVTTRMALDPGDPRTVEQWAASCAVSVRTFTRRFRDETGMPFSHWRTRLRVQAAVAQLAMGTPVAAVARRVGFESPSAFASAFRRETGTAPRAFGRGIRAE